MLSIEEYLHNWKVQILRAAWWVLRNFCSHATNRPFKKWNIIVTYLNPSHKMKTLLWFLASLVHFAYSRTSYTLIVHLKQVPVLLHNTFVWFLYVIAWISSLFFLITKFPKYVPLYILISKVWLATISWPQHMVFSVSFILVILVCVQRQHPELLFACVLTTCISHFGKSLFKRLPVF